ncbi:MAG: ATP-binding protein [Parvibaculales bacterium]|jgi:two-component system phosphate regulon sensor histidine kinase PhoR
MMEEFVARFNNLARLIDQPSVLVDRRGTVVLASQGAFELLGHHIAGQSFDGFIRHPDFVAALQMALTQDQQTDLLYTRMEQVPRQFEIRLAPFDKNHVFIALIDKTLERSVERIQSEFVANVSHELRSPLTSLSGFIETLMGPAADDKQAQEKFFPIMQSEATRMQRLIDGLLSLSRFEAEAHRPPTDAVDLRAIIDEVVAIKSHMADGRNIQIAVTSEWEDATQTPLVRGDRDELLEVFHNLLENAVKYSNEGSDVVFALSQGRDLAGATQDDRIRVQVTNTGPTIASQHISRLTERFYRIEEGRSRSMGGSGLGLAIVKHILNRHRGRLRITSENQQTCVSVTLPTER